MPDVTVTVRRQEVFVWRDDDLGLVFQWDISKAHGLDDYDVEQMFITDVAPLAKLLADGVGEADPDHALSDAVNLDIPIMALPMPGIDKQVLVDGWHRVYKADAQGVETLPIIILTPAQERAIRLSPTDEQIEEARRGRQ